MSTKTPTEWKAGMLKRRDLDCGGITDRWGITVCQGGKLKFNPRTATEHEKPLCKVRRH
jgi:hypothetical protein